MSWKSVHKEDNAFLSDESELLDHQLFQERLLSFVGVFDLLNQNVSTISFAASHLVISCCVSQAMINAFWETADKTEVTSHQESVLLGMKETQLGVAESNGLQIWDWRQNSRYGEYVELYETFGRLVK